MVHGLVQVAQEPGSVGVTSRHSVVAPASAVKVTRGFGSAVTAPGEEAMVGGSGGRVSVT